MRLTIIRLIVIAALLVPRPEAFAARSSNKLHRCCTSSHSCSMMKRKAPTQRCQWSQCDPSSPQRAPRAAVGALPVAPRHELPRVTAAPASAVTAMMTAGIATAIEHPPRRG